MYTSLGLLQNVAVGKSFKDYLPLVKKQAYLLLKKINYNAELDDLVQSGTIGLLDALDKFEDNNTATFETYAQKRIWGAMIDDLRKMDVVSYETRSLINTIEKETDKLINTIGVKPTEVQVASNCNISLKKYQETLQLKHSINIMSPTDEGFTSVIEKVIDEEQNIEENLVKREQKVLLVEAIDNLPEREKQIMALYYQEELTLKEIAHVLELTEARVSQLHNQIVAKLRMRLKEHFQN